MLPYQATRDTTTTAGTIVTTRPTSPARETRAGWANAAAPSRGWGIDQTDTATAPQAWSSNAGDATHPAIFWDSPGNWTTTTNAGSEFRTCLMCLRAGRPAVALACVTWGNYTNAAGVSALSPSPSAACGAATEFRDAATRWDAIRGNTPINLAP